MLEETQAESESHQAALRDCQDMLEELQTFSQGRETRLQSLQQELQVSLHFCSRNMHEICSAEVFGAASCTTETHNTFHMTAADINICVHTSLLNGTL